MKKQLMKKMTAVFTTFSILCGAISTQIGNKYSFATANIESSEVETEYNSSCSLDENNGVLTLEGNVVDNEVRQLENDICIAGGISVTLEGQIGVNIYLTACENLDKVIMSGPNGDIVFNCISESESIELPMNGSNEKAYKFTYPVNATQSNEIITLKAYDINGQQLIICKANGQICDCSQVTCTVRDYLKNLKKDVNENNSLQNIVNKFINYTANVLENYLNAADNYFNGTEHNINDIDYYINSIIPYIDGITENYDNVDYNYFKEKLKGLLVPIESFKPDFSDDIKLSLVLDSTISLRIYTDSNDVKYNEENLAPKSSTNGNYYEISNIFPNMLCNYFKVTIDGEEYNISPMTYVYRVLNNDNSNQKIKDMANAIYAYAVISHLYFSITTQFSDVAEEAAVSDQLYAWADYSEEDNTIIINWLEQEDALSYKVYDKKSPKHPLAEVSGETEFIYNINDFDTREEFIFYVKKISDQENVISNDIIIKRDKNGNYTFKDIDSDEDGLCDLNEICLKTDRLEKDTDNDGLTDGYEYFTLKTDPLLLASRQNGIPDGEDDFDGDGLSNAQEYTYSTNPFNGDTDNDGFPDGYEIINNMDSLTFDKLSLDNINVSETDDYGEYDLEILNLTEENSLDILYGENGLVKTIRGVFSDRKVKCAEDAFYAICNVRTLLGIQDPAKELKYSSFNSNNDVITYYFDTVYNGIIVYGRDITLTCDSDGKVSTITSYYIKNDDISKINTVPSITGKDLADIINKDSESKCEIISSDLYIKVDDEAVLAYKVATSKNEVIWIDAHSGKIIDRYSKNIVSYFTPSYVEDEEVGEDQKYKIWVYQADSQDIYEMNYYNKFAIYEIQQLNPTYDYSQDIITNNYNLDSGYYYYRYLNGEAEPKAVSAYYNMAKIYKWYYDNGYYGLDGEGTPFSVFFNCSLFRTENGVRSLCDNAAYTYIYGGEDSKSDIIFDCILIGQPQLKKYSLGSDLCLLGHEYGHAVFQHKSTGVDNKESINIMTLNEAYGDIFGSCVKGEWMQYEAPDRNIVDPHKTHNPAALEECKYDPNDPNDTDPHYNSTVLSHAAYIMNSKYGISMDDIWKIFYNSIGRIRDNTDLSDMGEIITTTARSLKYSDAVIYRINSAFNEVNITNERGSAQIVVMKNSRPLQNAEVSIEKNNISIVKLTTDNNGTVTFKDIDTGTYDVKVSSNDGRSVYAKITITPNMTIIKTIYFGEGSTDFDWTHYDHYNYNQKIGSTLEKHIDISDTAIKMIGYTEDPLKDFLLTNENDNEDSIIHARQKNISFSLKRDQNNWHTMEGGGFLFDVSITGANEETGSRGKLSAHCLLVTDSDDKNNYYLNPTAKKGSLKLCYLNNVDIDQLCDGKFETVTSLDLEYIANIEDRNKANFIPVFTKLSNNKYEIDNVYDEHNFTIRIDKSDKEYITVWDKTKDGEKVIIDRLCINRLEGDDFGPITSHISHYCSQVSYFTFSDINVNMISVN